ncbi:MAG: aminoglycoside 6-adenylyltransferase [Chloroflexi bacterium]|nr:MAG: aminoglycoside 6-adenylyltransferase [Chloroflexota bacterium]MBL1196321.1 aminoglycoside 6-adenylyltransferase [Chloroflexota bacterium]NOH13616.1 aminoglycoside 6-adenylyltransferase [Chloroflexota bacterium]
MRSEQDMFDLITNTALNDERIRAVILNGSRANPNAPYDIFQDYDIVYVVTDVASFTHDHDWIHLFGELMILQLPDEMGLPSETEGFHYLMQFADGNRIDLTLFPMSKLNKMEKDSLTVILLDKDDIFKTLEPANDSDYLPKPPTEKQYADCCNEFWWVSTYVAKGLWREQILYARHMQDQVMRKHLMQMLTWYMGVKTHFSKNLGAYGKYYEQYLDSELWEMLLLTYATAGYENTWAALFTICDLFRRVANTVAEHFGHVYPLEDDEKVIAHLKHVHSLPRDAERMY